MAGAEEQDQQAAHHPQTAGVNSTESPEQSQQVSLIEKSAQEIAKKAAEDTVRDNLPRFTEILGVFVALFTFVSINIQIFSRITSFNNALVFVTLEFLCLAGFVIMLDLLINQKRLWMFMVIVILTAVLIPVFLFYLPRTPLSIEEKSKIGELEQRINILEKRFDDQVIRKPH